MVTSKEPGRRGFGYNLPKEVERDLVALGSEDPTHAVRHHRNERGDWICCCGDHLPAPPEWGAMPGVSLTVTIGNMIEQIRKFLAYPRGEMSEEGRGGSEEHLRRLEGALAFLRTGGGDSVTGNPYSAPPQDGPTDES